MNTIKKRTIVVLSAALVISNAYGMHGKDGGTAADTANVTSSQTAIAGLKEKLQGLQKLQTQLQALPDQVSNELTDLRRANQHLTQAMDTLQTDHAGAIDQLNRQYQEQITQLKAKHDNDKATVDDKLRALKMAHSALEAEHNRLKTDSAAEVKKLHDELDTASTAIERFITQAGGFVGKVTTALQPTEGTDGDTTTTDT